MSIVAILILAFVAAPFIYRRIELTRAKHPSLQGHPRIASRLARFIRAYDYAEDRFFASDDAPASVAERRRVAFRELSASFEKASPRTIEATRELAVGVSDLQFTTAYAVPFQYRRYLNDHLRLGAIVAASDGVLIADLDGFASYDLAGSYGLNVFGYSFYKQCIEAGVERARALGPVLGSYHPVVQDNVDRLRAISALDEVSFHMSGTEAVMQAVRLARFHSGRSHVVRFAGAYNGWWDDVQPGVGNPRPARDTYTLRDMDERTLAVLRHRSDIACVLVNPLQGLHPNRAAPGDATLIASDRHAELRKEDYTQWLRQLRHVCTARGIALIFDEVFVGFRLARSGAQEYFGVAADMVTYGKSIGGGLPIGVLCGRADLMRRFRDDRPSDICFARGTFNSHPYVMTTMNEFLSAIDDPKIRASYDNVDAVWNERAARLNAAFEREALPVRVANFGSVWTVLYTQPSRYNWMFQFYLRAEGLRLSWVGTGRLIFSHNFTEDDFREVSARFIDAARKMDAAGWWWHTPQLTNAWIHRRVAREIVAARLSFLKPDPQAASSDTIGSMSSPRIKQRGAR